LTTFLLCHEGVLSQPLLYLSLYFKRNRRDYYDHLQKVRTDGEWEGWLNFFMRGVYETATQAVNTARSTLQMFEEHKHKIEALGRAASSILRVHEFMKRRPIFSIPDAVKELSLSQPTVSTSLDNLTKLGLVNELTQKSRNRVFAYAPFVAMLSDGTEPLPR
jgi:Fic family protein